MANFAWEKSRIVCSNGVVNLEPTQPSLTPSTCRCPSPGYSTLQKYGIDYEETFAHVARLTSVKCLIVVAVVRSWPLYQMDVKNAFLNGDLHEEVYMQPPPSYPHSGSQVCCLRCAFYGLKQTPRAWFEKFNSVVAQQGFTSSPHDTALFVQRSSAGITLILLYVDDMIIT